MDCEEWCEVSVDHEVVELDGVADRAGQQGQTMVKFLIETSGRPSQVSVDKSSGYPDLDAAAVSGVKAALLRPYIENGVARPIWAVVAITFKLN